MYRENSSVGRARPSQGRGRGFEPRFSLQRIVMNPSEKIFYPSVTPEYLRDCILHSAAIRFDRMPDNSWQRLVSDKPLAWLSDHIPQVISSSLEIKEHALSDEIFRWNNTKHIEIFIELREKKSTYLFTAEIAYEHLNYFLATYLVK